jgi:aspartyl-tRNA(Asn)/glutamyl-tRNA(Gln) amidotransferase subunit B
MTQAIDTSWQTVIGLEIHVQLNTKSKLFSEAPNTFGSEPNTNITDVCTGQPGTLPVLNEEAVKKAVQFGCAVNAHVARFSKFDRKSYFYPDSPRNYQITQFEEPIILGGSIAAEVEGEIKHFFINRAHLEDDSGMLKHFSTFAGIDYNRAGVPLIEIVSEPCIHSAKEAVAYASAIKSIMLYIDASDCNMDEGSLRVDVNVSVRPVGETTLRNKIEIKNMNSFSNMELAIDAEIRRQIELYTLHADLPPSEVIQQGTCRFDPEIKKAVFMRTKEDAQDYRYFPEPDLVPIILSETYIEEIAKSLPELPQNRFKRYVEILNLSKDAAETLILDKPLSDYFEEASPSCKNPKALSNWIIVEFTGRLKEINKTLKDSGIPSAHVSSLVNMIEEGTITGKIAKCVADEMVANPGKDPREIVKSNPEYQPISDLASIEPLVDQVLKENGQSILDYKAGKARAFGFLVGQVMKLTKGSASPSLVNDLLTKKLEEY